MTDKPQMSVDAQAVALLLSDAQKKALLWATLVPQSWPKGSEASLYKLSSWTNGNTTKCVCMAASLVKQAGRSAATSKDWFGKTLWVLTPIGEKVRAILQEQTA